MKATVRLFLFLAVLVSCKPSPSTSDATNTSPEVHIAGAMKNVMWQGELAGVIRLDTIQDKAGLYGLGPESFLTGELLINDGKCYVSRVLSDSTMTVEERCDVSAPFFVYGNVTEWTEMTLPAEVKTTKDVEAFVEQHATHLTAPFAFKLTGEINSAVIHVQNLPANTSVSSPVEAHQGQTNYPIGKQEATIVGFFSKEHQGIFTHHDSFIHLHLITADARKMGHLDQLDISQMTLYLPKS
ncbi:MAG: acetolactate decarboxylase [Flavobacteriales bacterium]|nr:acetolactate decarboxylase [Bacteroidota bacterium]MCB9241938.1 acetolactate decarboxylase [Flavobacteriales bacterium]